MHYPSINLNIHPSLRSTLAMFLPSLSDSFPTYYIFHYHLSSPHLSRTPFSLMLPRTRPPPTLHSSTQLSVSLFFSSCSSRQPSWQQATEVTSRPAWPSPPRRSTRWGRSTSTASHPPPWPRCRVSFIKPWVSTWFHSLSSCDCVCVCVCVCVCTLRAMQQAGSVICLCRCL